MSRFLSEVSEVAAWRDELDRQGKRLVFTNGCFDLLHPGHVRYLNEARKAGDALVVALNGDASVRTIKGPGRPILNEEERAEMLRGLRAVDRVVVFHETTALECLRRIRPHVYAKGGDYRPETLQPDEQALLREMGAETVILSLVKGQSTSDLVKRMSGGKTGKVRLAVLGSGTGSNFEAIAEAVAAGKLDADIRLVLADVPGAGILEKAQRRGLPAMYLDPGRKGFRLTPAACKAYADRIRAAEVDVVVLAGFMRKVEGELLEAFAGRILNIHPSLLPLFPGKDAWKQALAAGASEAGCTVHIVNEEIDAGPILGQSRLEIRPGETEDSLIARIHVLEHELYPRMIGEFAAKLAREV
jgi:formyltetrahydrofolate-dependent phosphoribosylglycinamide formyltransferase